MSPTFSIIVPSFNQSNYIEKTINNLTELKQKALFKNISIEVLLFDNCSNADTQLIIEKHKSLFNVLVIEKDKGQYDAINHGVLTCTGDYWTWLNTDDLIDIDGFLKMVEVLRLNHNIDYIYGGIDYIDENDDFLYNCPSYPINFKTLYSSSPTIFQPGSFFKKTFTDKIGLLYHYQCCFDYEYILRCLKHQAKFYQCEFPVSKFRYYKTSKTGSITPIFIKEQLLISKIYGRKWYHYLTGFSELRLLKHFLFPRK